MATLTSSAQTKERPAARDSALLIARGVLAFAVVSAILSAAIWLRDLGMNPWRYPKWDDGWMAELFEWVPRLSGVVYALAGVMILSRKRAHRVGLLCVLFAFLVALYDVLTTLPLIVTAYSTILPIFVTARLAFGLLFPVPFIWLLLVFPTGTFQSPRWRALAWLAMLSWVQPLLYLFIAPSFWLSPSDTEIANPFYIGVWQERARYEYIEGIVTNAFLAFSFMLMALALAGYVRRMRSAEPLVRRQMQWLALVFGALLLCFIIGRLVATGSNDGWLFYMLGVLVLLMGTPFAIVIAILRHHLFDVDVVLNRALVYGAMVVLIAAAYALIVGGLSALFNTSGNLLFGILATGIIAVLFNPIRARMQRVVNRLIYGEPANPAATLTRIHRLIETAPTSDAAMQSLLEEISREPAAAQHAARLMRDLQRSRERIVTAREEERLRMRRDLHDGLGPTLAAQTLQLDAALDLMDTDPAKAKVVLGQLKRRTQATVSDVRRLVYALRPPALDEQGLVGAIRNFAASINDLAVTVNAPDALPPLPAAVEVAAYRIATEAITNVIRHAKTTRCAVAIQTSKVSETSEVLRVFITDDGIGIDPSHPIGVGLRSMRERAEELGGKLTIESKVGQGTTIMAELPISNPQSKIENG
jgi:signal transduction histidine kinase